ncbi:MAG: amino acid permease [Desulfobacterales bacterium]|nr:amino acid permease [Desulfobacterales bacterium]
MASPSEKLVKGLTLVTLFSLITGAMVGMGWAVLANVMVDRAGPGVMISMALAAVFSLFIGLCYAELCSAMPKAGGEYIYVKRGMGPFSGFFAGWVLILAYAAMMPGECIILGKLIHGLNPDLSPALTGAGIAVFFTLVNLVGVRLSGRVQLFFTLVLFLGIFLYVAAALPKIHMENITPFMGRGWGGVLLMVPLSMLAFMGFDVLPQAAEEIQAPIRKMVFLIPASIGVVGLFYVATTLANVGLEPWEKLAQSTDEIPILSPVTLALGERGGLIIITAGICGLLTTMNAFMMGGSRLLMAMARDGEIPAFLGRVHPRFRTPHMALIFLGIMGVAGAYFTEMIVLFDTAAAAVLICYILVAVSVMRLRKNEPEMERPYAIKAYPLVPILAIVSVIPTWGIAMALLKPVALVCFVLWLVLGLIYYRFVKKGTAVHEERIHS